MRAEQGEQSTLWTIPALGTPTVTTATTHPTSDNAIDETTLYPIQHITMTWHRTNLHFSTSAF